MRRTAAIALAVLVGTLTFAGLAQARSASVHQAVIEITKTRVNATTDVVRVTVRITQFFTGGHWQLLWKKQGTSQKARNKVSVMTGNAGSTRTLAAGRWVLTVRLVNPRGVPYKPSQYPMATLSDTTSVTIR